MFRGWGGRISHTVHEEERDSSCPLLTTDRFFPTSGDCEVSFRLGDSQESPFMGKLRFRSGSGTFFTRLTIGVSELQVLLHEVEGGMREGERAAFTMSQ
jgi:hypothetical protein